MDNYFIADQFSLLARLMDIHGENSFKSKSYSIAAYTIEQLPVQLIDTPKEKRFTIKGIGEATAKKIQEIIDTGELTQLKTIVSNTPPGILEMLAIKGLGPKKINTIWKEMEIESVGELLYACNENRLLLYKGFGEKTQKAIQDAIQFYLNNQGSFLYAQIESYADAMHTKLLAALPESRFEFTGEFKRQMEVINSLDWVTTASESQLINFFEEEGFKKEDHTGELITFKGTGIRLIFYVTSEAEFFNKLVETSGSEDFIDAILKTAQRPGTGAPTSEVEYFSYRNLPYIPTCLRETAEVLQMPEMPDLIQSSDIKGIIHSHSNWSDGVNTIEEMAVACKNMQLEYLVISDHSKSAVYAKGLNEERIIQQHLYIDELNEKLTPFKIFKGIECDILTDGSLDYADEVLATFEVVITSIHSNFKMTEDKATQRLIRAIENPYTTILGHLTGRLLLSRNGYPVDKKKIIEACAANKVVIEHNAHPRRLDMDWRWMSYAIEKGVLLSIDPDAHAITAFNDVRYGVLTAQKGGVTKENNLSSFSLQAFTEYLALRKNSRSL